MLMKHIFASSAVLMFKLYFICIGIDYGTEVKISDGSEIYHVYVLFCKIYSIYNFWRIENEGGQRKSYKTFEDCKRAA